MGKTGAKYRGPARKQVSRTTTVKAPVGGLNAMDALSDMPPGDAIILDNFFPDTTYVSLRNGYSNWKTGFPGWVETIMPYSGATGSKLFGISSTSVYDATSSGPVGGAVVTGLTNARWEYTNIATAAGQYLYAMNGVDRPLLYDNSVWRKINATSSIAITGVTTTLLRNPIVWKNRLWMIEDQTLNAWYLPTASIGGAASKFPLTAIFKEGGQLQAIMTASLTDGSTFDDYIFFLTTEGEIAMYRGTDPAVAGLFILTGIYKVGKPLGRRCWFKYGQDAIILCADGAVSLEKMISIGRTGQNESISYKILHLITSDAQTYANNFGWQGVVHPTGNKLYINVPQSTNNVQYQYVMNTIPTPEGNSWCRFVNWNAATFAIQANNLYFGGATYIALADTGQSDNGVAINGVMKTAFNYFRTDQQKFVKMVRPLIQTSGTINPSLAVNVDFQDNPPFGNGTYIATTGSAWDTSPWDTTPWASDTFIQKDWKTVYGVGFAISMYVKVSALNININVQALDYTWEPGGVL
jgi:hypothetical protein